MMACFIRYLSYSTGKCNGKTEIFPGFVNPGDFREMKKIAILLKVPFIMFPDQSGVMDAPMTGDYAMYPKGGTTVPEIVELGDCKKVLALGELTSEEPSTILERKCKVPYTLLPLPIGIDATDKFIMELSQLSNGEVPYELEEERGQLVDLMLDAHFYFFNKTVAIFGDPDTVLGLTRLVLEMGMIPKYVLTGTPGDNFVRLAQELFNQFGVEGCTAKAAGDLFELHQWIKNEKVDLLLGTTYGKQIARAEDIPFIRAGFPVLDRYAHSSFPIVGYKGAMRMVQAIADTLMDRQDKECSDEDFEIVM
jgi:nitrogenase molybdenum-iron protein beta chain